MLVWLDLVLHMSQYVKECQDNIKSGKVCLFLCDIIDHVSSKIVCYDYSRLSCKWAIENLKSFTVIV